MKLKFYFASFIALFLVLDGFAQKKQNVYFLKNDGRYVDLKDSADYIRVVQEPDSGTVLYNVLEYYLNGNQKFIGKSSSVEPIRLEGTTASFYPNKTRKRIASYEKGRVSGLVYDYYPNGKLYRNIEFKPIFTKPGFESDETIHDVYDSTGIQTVINGNGHYVVIDLENRFREEGDVKDGKRNGSWKGTANHGKVSFTEEYASGKFINGVSTDANGQTKNYAVKEVLPEFKGGANAFGRFLSNNINYPLEAKQRGIQGRVLLSFVIEKDGSLADIKVLQSVFPQIDAEAVRVIRQSPKWNPGLQHGVPVKVSYTMPINFTLGR